MCIAVVRHVVQRPRVHGGLEPDPHRPPMLRRPDTLVAADHLPRVVGHAAHLRDLVDDAAPLAELVVAARIVSL